MEFRAFTFGTVFDIAAVSLSRTLYNAGSGNGKLPFYAPLKPNRSHGPSITLQTVPSIIETTLTSPLYQKLNDPRQSRGLIFVSPSKGQVHEPPEGG